MEGHKHPELTAKRISWLLAHQHFDVRRDIIVPNCTGMTTLGEADLLICRKSGWLTEVEIKISRADFKRDFSSKPFKHKCLELGRPAYSDKVWDEPTREEVLAIKARPGSRLANDEALERWYCENQWDWEKVSAHLVRYFYFAMPDALADTMMADVPSICEIPAYAGLLGISETYPYVRKLKEAPKLNARKLTEAERIKLLLFAHARYWDKVLRPEAFGR